MRNSVFRIGLQEKIGSKRLVRRCYTLDQLITGKCWDNDRYEVVSKDQWTGLVDKNSKEIYEGDILREPAKDEWEEKNYVGYEVFYHDNDCADRNVGFQLNRMHFFGSICGAHLLFGMLPKYTRRLIVIGNIHDNPELITPASESAP